MGTREPSKLAIGRHGDTQPHIQKEPGMKREKYWFGTDEEVDHRDVTALNSATIPPPRFEQIVAADTDRDANSPSGPTHRGDFKFSGGPKHSGLGA